MRIDEKTARAVLVLLFVATATTFAACNDDTEGGETAADPNPDALLEPDMGPGQQPDPQPAPQPDPQPDGNPGMGPGMEPDPQPAPEPDPEPTPDPICEEGAVRCVGEAAIERCSEDLTAWEAEPCDVGTVCVDEQAACVSVICQPGASLGCGSNTAQLVCNDTGTGNTLEECPEPAACIDGGCVVGEGSCITDDECGNDTYCERNICLPYPGPPRGDANGSCLQAPYEGEFSPEIQCWWQDGNVIMQPAVVDLDGDETPEIIFTFWDGGGGGRGTVIAIRGDDCQEVARTPDNFDIEIQASLAVGDITGDGSPEIVTMGGGGEIRAFNSQLQLVWQSPTLGDSNTWGGPAIADLDKDGLPEVVFGGIVLNGEDGSLAWSAGTLRYSQGSLTAIADVDGDGDNEVVLGNRIFGPDGTDETPPGILNLPNGHVAIADFDRNTREPEIAVVAQGGIVRIQTFDGNVIFGPFNIPNNTQNGGAPNVGDFDGDGEVEIGTAGARSYVVFDMECDVQPLPEHCEAQGIRWTKPTRDASSGVTGSSLFDFEGDGQSDVVYNDECFLRVYDGATGAVKVAFPNTTNTTYENPVVADVDGDFNSEIVIPANDLARCNPGTDTDPDTGTLPLSRRGVVVLRDVTDRWVNSRPIWNQHTYHITNVNDDGTIPINEDDNWLRFNNYRQNLNNEGKALYAPDMTASDALVFERTACGSVDIEAEIFNRGSQPISRGVPVSFFTGDPNEDGQFICQTATTTRLDPGQGETLGCTWANPPNEATQLYVVADANFDTEGQTIVNGNTECYELNNWAIIEVPACQ